MLTWHSGSLGPVETPRAGARREGLAHLLDDDASMMRSVNDGDLAPDRLLASARGCGDRQMFSLKPFHDQIVRKIRGLPAADTGCGVRGVDVVF